MLLEASRQRNFVADSCFRWKFLQKMTNLGIWGNPILGKLGTTLVDLDGR